jgi:hypothetical protein
MGGEMSDQNGRRHGNHTWSVAEDEHLAWLEQQGYSASLIGERMGRSTNAVIGRSHRLRGYRHRRGTKATPRTTVVTVKKQPVPRPKAPDSKPGDPGRRMITIFDLDQNTCRWPFGERHPYRFCGAPPTRAGASYCQIHARLNFK